jgi:hypothetical protein
MKTAAPRKALGLLAGFHERGRGDLVAGAITAFLARPGNATVLKTIAAT